MNNEIQFKERKKGQLPPILIPSYHRANRQKTVKIFVKRVKYPPELIWVFIDDECDDKEEYQKECTKWGVNLEVFNMEEARLRYDFVSRATKSRRAAGLARNTFHDWARKHGIRYYVVIDDDTIDFKIYVAGRYFRTKELKDPEEVYTRVKQVFAGVVDFMQTRHIGLWGLSQGGDFFSDTIDTNLMRKKVQNTMFIDAAFLYRGERAVQDDDTSQFATIWNVGLLTGSVRGGEVLFQTPSATQPGGNTEVVYQENKLLQKAAMIPIQLPSVAIIEYQKQNGGRLHHRINYRYLSPCIMKGPKERANVAWDTYSEDVPFTNEPRWNDWRKRWWKEEQKAKTTDIKEKEDTMVERRTKSKNNRYKIKRRFTTLMRNDKNINTDKRR